MFKEPIRNPKRIDSRITFFIICSVFVLIILLILDLKYIKSWDGILIEAHGLFFDILLFGIILAIYDFKRKKKDKIESLLEELDDYRHWKSEEAMRRNVGIIKRLAKLGIIEIDLSYSFLDGADLESFNLSGSKMHRTYLKKANIANCNFSKVDLSWAEVQGSHIINSDFSNTNLSCTLFSEALIIRSDFSGSELTNAKFSDARVHDLDFLERLKKNKGFKSVNRKFIVNNELVEHELGGQPYYEIKRRK